jgi:SAM-dependent methyltransferase
MTEAGSELLDVLADPVTGAPLRLQQGALVGDSGVFPVIDGIPRFVTDVDAKQKQTEESFAYIWQQQRDFSKAGRAVNRAWLVERYGFASVDDMRAYFARSGRILDAGCGGAFTASLWMTPAWGGTMWVGADISRAVDLARDQLNGIPNTHFMQADVLHLPIRERSFDVIFSEGVLHHTPSTERAFKGLVRLLKPGGELMVYVYRKKAPLREFADDYIRSILSSLRPDEATTLLRPLTAFGKALADLKTEVEIPEDVELLGIKAGRYDVQRLIYWHFAKAFWNDAYTFDENLYNNFDWYHPAYAHRHTEEEVRGWCAAAALTITHFHSCESGFTVRARRA